MPWTNNIFKIALLVMIGVSQIHKIGRGHLYWYQGYLKWLGDMDRSYAGEAAAVSDIRDG